MEKNSLLDCAAEPILPVVQGKWTMVVLSFIRQGTIRFGELSRKLPMVSQANLTKALRTLESFGLIHREVYREVPPRVEYSLTELGEKFLPVLDALEDSGIEFQNLNKEANV